MVLFIGSPSRRVKGEAGVGQQIQVRLGRRLTAVAEGPNFEQGDRWPTSLIPLDHRGFSLILDVSCNSSTRLNNNTDTRSSFACSQLNTRRCLQGSACISEGSIKAGKVSFFLIASLFLCFIDFRFGLPSCDRFAYAVERDCDGARSYVSNCRSFG